MTSVLKFICGFLLVFSVFLLLTGNDFIDILRLLGLILLIIIGSFFVITIFYYVINFIWKYLFNIIKSKDLLCFILNNYPACKNTYSPIELANTYADFIIFQKSFNKNLDDCILKFWLQYIEPLNKGQRENFTKQLTEILSQKGFTIKSRPD